MDTVRSFPREFRCRSADGVLHEKGQNRYPGGCRGVRAGPVPGGPAGSVRCVRRQSRHRFRLSVRGHSVRGHRLLRVLLLRLPAGAPRAWNRIWQPCRPPWSRREEPLSRSLTYRSRRLRAAASRDSQHPTHSSAETCSIQPARRTPRRPIRLGLCDRHRRRPPRTTRPRRSPGMSWLMSPPR